MYYLGRSSQLLRVFPEVFPRFLGLIPTSLQLLLLFNRAVKVIFKTPPSYYHYLGGGIN